MFNRLVGTFAEPSTYAGLSGIALAFGATDSQWQQISAAAAGVFGVIAMVLRENRKAS